MLGIRFQRFRASYPDVSCSVTFLGHPTRQSVMNIEIAYYQGLADRFLVATPSTDVLVATPFTTCRRAEPSLAFPCWCGSCKNLWFSAIDACLGLHLHCLKESNFSKPSLALPWRSRADCGCQRLNWRLAPPWPPSRAILGLLRALKALWQGPSLGLACAFSLD